jgi:hypothetical protein
VETGFGELDGTPAAVQQATSTVNTVADTGEPEDPDADLDARLAALLPNTSITNRNTVSGFMGAVVPAAVSTWINTTTKADLFSRAKDAIAAGDQSLHDAAEALALAREDFKASQREIADAVGKSVAWVNRLLQWRRQGFVGTPFGPGSKARRERQKSVQAPEQRAPSKIGADNAEASTEKFRTEHAEREAEPKTTTVNSPLAGFKSAVDWWFPKMDYSAKCEAVEYAIAKSKARASCAIDK